ncbi:MULTISPECIES: LuxR C-terminal-related transcriptional regulator [unclassified Streptomyces]|uniref:helix-turn-helix transcriptional regulator n=1 Tax=unclassified Streptomyces TaxID=2593676 RepID=UPI00380D54D7
MTPALALAPAPAPLRAPAPRLRAVPAPAPAPPAAPLVVRVPPARGADRVRALARRAGLTCATETADPAATAPGAVTVRVAADAEQALRAVRVSGPLVLVCDTADRAGRLRALRSGAVVLPAADLTAPALAAAVRRAARPQPSIPYQELAHLLLRDPADSRDPSGPASDTPASGAGSGTGPGSSGGAARPPALTVRQASVLRLMADGHANADIARLLGCSEHTVKNVIYEVMSRLQVRNRAHAVAHAVRHGLV